MVPFFELKRQYKNLKTELDSALQTVMERGIYTLGTEVGAFENELAKYVGCTRAIGVASGTDALTLALKALDIGSKDEVIMPANAYPTAFGVAESGCKIRLVDCGTDGNMDVEKLSQVITSRTKVVIPVHLYGSPSDFFRIKKLLIGQKLKAYILEDAAQAIGAEIYDGSTWRKVGSIGEIGIFSFYPTKNLGAYGDGGMLVTNNKKLAHRLKALRMYGEVSRYHSIYISGVSRLDELQAAILRVKFRYLDEWNRRRREIAEYYAKELEGVEEIRMLNAECQMPNNTVRSCNHLFVIRVKKRDELQKYLMDKRIGCGIHYPVPVHLTPSFKHLGYKKGDFPMAEAQSHEVLSLPLFPELTDTEIDEVIRKVKKFY